MEVWRIRVHRSHPAYAQRLSKIAEASAAPGLTSSPARAESQYRFPAAPNLGAFKMRREVLHVMNTPLSQDRCLHTSVVPERENSRSAKLSGASLTN